MNVLKNFGISILTLLIASPALFAQNANTNNLKTASTSVPLRMEQTQYATQFIPKSNAKIATTTEVSPSSKVSDQEIYNSRIVKKESKPAQTSSSANIANEMMSWVKDKYSSMINVMPNQLSNVMLYSFIDDWYGTKYRMGGTSKKGVDCSAFVQNLYKYVFGMNIVRTACLQFNASERVRSISDLKEGDLVFFRVNTSRISHVGVYLSNNYFVHSASSKGVSIARLDNKYWSKFYAGGGRIITN